MYYLYTKTHNKTGLKYLGKTEKDPFAYKGSGKYWVRHLKVHGNDITTDIIGMYEREETLKEAGEFYSNLWNVVESNDWANLKPETGDGGAYPIIHSEATKKKMSIAHKGKIFSEKTKQKIRKKRINQVFSEETRQKMSAAKIGRKLPKISDALKGRKLTDEWKLKISLAMKKNK